MKINHLMFFLILAAFVWSCDNQEKSVIRFTEFPETVKKTTVTKTLKSNYQISDFFITGNILITVNVWVENGYYITYFDKNTLEYIGRTGRRGKAPGEVVRAMYPTIDHENKKIFLTDEGGNRKIYEFDIEASIKDTDYIPKKLFEIGMNRYYAGNLTYCDNDIFMFGYYHQAEDSVEYSYSFIDKSDKFLGSYVEFPFKKDIPLEAYCTLVYRNIVFRNGNLFTAYQYIDKINSFNVSQKKMNFETNGPYLLKPEVEVHADQWVPFETERTVAYISIAASDKYVYGLYSGEVENARNYAPDCAKTIHVFDYSGNPVQKIELDQNIIQITYDEETNSLVGIQNDEKTGMNTQGLVWIKL